MKVAIDTQSMFGRKAGIGRYTAELMAALLRIGSEHEYLPMNLGKNVVMRTDRRLKWQQWGLPHRTKRLCADVLHVTGSDPPLWKPCPVVLTVHDLIGRLFPGNLPPVSRMYWAHWFPMTIHFADVVIANSEATRNDILKTLRIRPKVVEVVYLGVESRFHPQTSPSIQACLDRYGLTKPYILYVGTIEPRKGIDTLIHAFARLAQQFPHDLVLAGQHGCIGNLFSSRSAIMIWPTVSISSNTYRTRLCRPCIPVRRFWPCLPGTKDSGFRFWKPWPAARRWFVPTWPPCLKSQDRPRLWFRRTTRRCWPTPSSPSSPTRIWPKVWSRPG